MTAKQNNGGESGIKYKKVIQVGVSTIVNDEPQSVITNKVLCTRALLVDINRCCHCPCNKGLLNQYVMRCDHNEEQPLPDEISMDIDYPEVKSDGKQKE
jgi:hypothetical protein